MNNIRRRFNLLELLPARHSKESTASGSEIVQNQVDETVSDETSPVDPNDGLGGPNPDVDLERVGPNPKTRWWSMCRGQFSKFLPPAQQNTFLQFLHGALFSSRVNFLLILLPVGIILHFIAVNPIMVFFINFSVIIPLAGVSKFRVVS